MKNKTTTKNNCTKCKSGKLREMVTVWISVPRGREIVSNKDLARKDVHIEGCKYSPNEVWCDNCGH